MQIISGFSEDATHYFLTVPRQLGNKWQDVKTEKQLLTKTHVLSHYFDVYPIVVMDEDKPVGRCLLTMYKNEETAYIGYFEAESDAVADLLLQEAERVALINKRIKLVATVDASFWIKYRLKVNRAGESYACEPYNDVRYVDYFSDFGFMFSDVYFSNEYRVPTEADRNSKSESRLQRALDNGYRFENLSFSRFKEQLKAIHGLLITCYVNFPEFRCISEDEFVSLFKGLRWVLDYDMVKLCYKDKDLVGFFVCIPDYGHWLSANISPRVLYHILKVKFSKDKRYVMLYLGISKDHPGIGVALSELIKQELVKKQARSIGALIHESKVTNFYYRDLIVGRYEYCLMEKILI